MKFSYQGDLGEAQARIDEATQALYRQRTLTETMGVRYRTFGPIALSPRPNSTAILYGTIAKDIGLEHVHIVVKSEQSLAAGQMYFEFGCSGYPVQTWTLTQVGTDFTSYAGCVVGTRLDLPGLKPDPVINTGQRQLNLSAASAVHRAFQVQLKNEPAGYVGSSTIYTTYAPINPYTGIYDASVNWERPLRTNTETGSEQSFSQRDIGFDVPFEYGVITNPVTLAVVQGSADWPRASGVQTVAGRIFAIYIDAFATVYAFPLLGIGPFNGDSFAQNIADALIRSAKVTFPTWAFVPPAKAMDQAVDIGSWFVNSPDIQWMLNHTGTKACCVLHEREESVLDTGYMDDPATHLEFGAPVLGETGTQQRFWQGTDNFSVTKLYSYGRGVFEIVIDIQLTGPGLGDFALNVAGGEIRTPRGSDRGTYMAGYCWQNIGGLRAGDMLLLDIERWYQPDESIVDPSEPVAGNWNLMWIDTEEHTDVEVPFTELVTIVPWSTPAQSMADYLDGDDAGKVGTGEDPFIFRFFNGDAIRNLWSEPFVTGQAQSFFSLRRRRGSDEKEVIAIYGESLLGIDFKSAALAVGIESVEFVTKSVTLSSGATQFPGITATASMPHRISHPSVAIYTQGKLKSVLIPDSASDTLTLAMQAKAKANPRDGLGSAWTYMPANDLRDWSSGNLPQLRDFQVSMHNLEGTYPDRLPNDRPSTHPLQALSVQIRNWWIAGMCVNSSCRPLLLLTNPNFGWAVYTSEVINRTQVADTTFFSHPNGSWAFYDASRIYNTYGVPDIFGTYDATNANSLLPPTVSSSLGARNALVISTVPFSLPDFPFLLETGNDLNAITYEVAAYAQMRRFINDNAGPLPAYVNTDSALSIAGVDGNANQPSSVNIWKLYDTLTPAVGASFKHQIFDHIHLEKTLSDGSVPASDTSFFEMYNMAVAKLGAQNHDTALLPITTDQLRAKLTPSAVTFDDGTTALSLKIDWAGTDPFFIVDRAYKSDAGQDVLRGGLSLKPRLTGTFSSSAVGIGLERITVFAPTFSTCLLLDLSPQAAQ